MNLQNIKFLFKITEEETLKQRYQDFQCQEIQLNTQQKETKQQQSQSDSVNFLKKTQHIIYNNQKPQHRTIDLEKIARSQNKLINMQASVKISPENVCYLAKRQQRILDQIFNKMKIQSDQEITEEQFYEIMLKFHYLEANDGRRDISDAIYEEMFKLERITKQYLQQLFILFEIQDYFQDDQKDIQQLMKDNEYEVYQDIIYAYGYLQKEKAFYDRSNPLTNQIQPIQQQEVDQKHKKINDELALQKKQREYKEAQEFGITEYDINKPLFMNSTIQANIAQNKKNKMIAEKQQEELNSLKKYNRITDQQIEEFQQRQYEYQLKKMKDIDNFRQEQEKKNQQKEEEYQKNLAQYFSQTQRKIDINSQDQRSIYEDSLTTSLIERYQKGREEKERIKQGPQTIKIPYAQLRQQQLQDSVLQSTMRLTQPLSKSNREQKVLLTIIVNLSQSGKTANIQITEQNRCPEKLGYDFCLTYGLNKAKYLILVQLLKDKMEESGIDIQSPIISAEKYAEKIEKSHGLQPEQKAKQDPSIVQLSQQSTKQPKRKITTQHQSTKMSTMQSTTQPGVTEQIESLKNSLHNSDIANILSSNSSNDQAYQQYYRSPEMQQYPHPVYINDPEHPNPFINAPIQNSLLDSIKTLIGEEMKQ